MSAPPIPRVGFRFPNRNLGQTPLSPGNVIAVIGAGTIPDMTVNVPRSLGGSADNVVDQAGYGPGPDLCANLVQGGATVVYVPCDYTPPTPTAVTPGSGNTGATVMTVTGDPHDQYMGVIVTCVRAGTVGGTVPPRVTVSLDYGNSSTGAINVPADGDLDALVATTGMQFEFTAATMDLGDTFSFSVPYPTVAAADVVTALRALRNSTEAFSMVYVCGPFGRADVDTIVAEVATFESRKKFVAGLFVEGVDAGGDSESTWMANLATDFEGEANDLLVVSAGYNPVRSVVLGCLMWRSIGWGAAVRASLVAISRDLGCREDGALTSFGTEATQGPLITKPLLRNAVALPTGFFIHDESLNPGLNADQFMTIMSEEGLAGYWITNPNLMSGPLSDYNLLQFRRISAEIARLTNIYLTLQLSKDILLSADGLILDKEAKKWEQGNDTALAGLTTRQNVSSLGTVIGRDSNIIDNEPIPVSVRWQPKGYAKVFDVSIAMTRTAA